MRQAGGAVVRRTVGSVKAFWRLIFGVTGERGDGKGSHLHSPPSLRLTHYLAKSPCPFFLTPLWQHLFTTKLFLSSTSFPHTLSQPPQILPLNFPSPYPLIPSILFFSHPHMLFFPLSTLSLNTPFLQKCLLFNISSLLNL